MSANNLYTAALNADAAYQNELVREYGNGAGDARYDSSLNAATPALQAARARFLAASEAWQQTNAE